MVLKNDMDHRADLHLAFQWGQEYACSGKAASILEDFTAQFGQTHSEYHKEFERGVQCELKKGG